MTQIQTVTHYGIHRDEEGIAWLMQGRGSTNVLGLKKKPPFKVQLPTGSKHCNHQIPMTVPVPNDFQWDFFVQLMDDPLVQAALPVPKKAGGAYFVDDPHGDMMWYLSLVSRMSAPIYPIVVPRWITTEQNIVKELQQTNVQPYFVADVEVKDSAFLSKVSKAAISMPRKLIVSGHPDTVVPQTMSRVQTSLNDHNLYDPNDLEALHWEGLGATLLRKHMKAEPIDKTASQFSGRRSREAGSS